MLRALALTGLLGLGCQSLSLPSQPVEGNDADKLWEKGQEAMRQGQTEQAMALYEESLRKDDRCSRNHLSLAAAHMAKGNEETACVHLAQFLQANPEHHNGRFYYAELLLRRGQHRQACDEFEQVLAQAQDTSAQDVNHLLHCHSRLTEIAESSDDAYTLHLHRGIGLSLLARSVAEMEGDGMPSAESLLCKAAGELMQAHNLRPEEARPSWYLYEVWRRLAQPHQAARWLQDACQTAPASYLSPAEHRSLELVCRSRTQLARP